MPRTPASRSKQRGESPLKQNLLAGLISGLVVAAIGAFVGTWIGPPEIKATYFAPLPPIVVTPQNRHVGGGAIGPPPPSRTWSGDTGVAPRRDADMVAKERVKPGRKTSTRR